MPDRMGHWRGTPVLTTALRTTSEDFGLWQNRTYERSAPAASIEVNLTDGPGAGTLRVPEEEAARSDAPLGFASTYRTLDVAERRAILERGEVTGIALAVRCAENRTLTLESKSVSEPELLDFANRLVHILREADAKKAGAPR